MKKIKEIDGMPVGEQRLLFNGRQLESKNTLAFYGVVDMCTIQTVLRQVGGGWLNECIDIYEKIKYLWWKFSSVADPDP